MAQTLHEGISFILTEDASTLYKYKVYGFINFLNSVIGTGLLNR